MSLQSLQFISDITAPGKNSLLTGLYSQAAAGPTITFRNDINAAVFYPLAPSSDSNRFWDSVFIATDRLLLGIGNADEPPIGGTWDLSYSAVSTGTSDMVFNISEAALTDALAANSGITGAGGATATLLAEGVYQISFTTVGAKSLITTDATGLNPQSSAFVSRYVTGDAGTKEIQIIQLVQRPYVYVDTWAETPDPTAVLTTITNGTNDPDGTTASYLITLTGELYNGSFTLTLDGQDFAIPFNAQATTFAGIIGSGWTVSQITSKQWAVQSVSVGVTTAAVSGTNLIAYRGLIGTLAFNSTSLLLAFLEAGPGVDELEAKLQIRYVDGTTERDTLLFADVSITRDVLSAAALAPTNWNQYYLTADQIYALLADPTYFAALDLSGLPTSNPGGGKPWLNGGVLQIGA